MIISLSFNSAFGVKDRPSSLFRGQGSSTTRGPESVAHELFAALYHTFKEYGYLEAFFFIYMMP